MGSEDISKTFVREIELCAGQDADTKCTLHIHQMSVGDVGCVVWDAALVLLKYLFTRKGNKYVKGNNVLELGAGTGVVGLAAACAGASDVVVTDLPQFTSLITLNIKENCNVTKDCRVQGNVLCWGNENDIKNACQASMKTTSDPNTSHQTFNIKCVLIADCIYYEDGVHSLYETITLLFKLCDPLMRILCSFEHRNTGNKEFLLKTFFKLLHSNNEITYENIPHSDMDEVFRSDDIHIIVIRRKS
ncbi:protein N-lysine methyltransferase METTL21D-like [Clavelina lepadiformis]|uniref:protein N-lysine methyltransferase METTL21D-like n=1 Tax=Clavelina lepadiformis TaxID=159417 RepID=UPI00404127DF